MGNTGDENPFGDLHRLPVWCVYIELPKPPFQGVFAHINLSFPGKKDSLVLTFVKNTDTIDNLYQAVIELSVGDLEEGLKSILKTRQKLFEETGVTPKPVTIPAEVFNILGNVISLVLYLCSVNADCQRLERPEPKRIKRGFRHFPPPAPRIIDVGLVVGAALRAGTQEQIARDAEEPGASVRAHIRRDHWHHYRIGPRHDQELILKWLSPILVNAQNGSIETTVHSVPGSR